MNRDFSCQNLLNMNVLTWERSFAFCLQNFKHRSLHLFRLIKIVARLTFDNTYTGKTLVIPNWCADYWCHCNIFLCKRKFPFLFGSDSSDFYKPQKYDFLSVDAKMIFLYVCVNHGCYLIHPCLKMFPKPFIKATRKCPLLSKK